ncbi:hypothetical protein ACTACD_05550 [Pseudomonas syringae]|uniref:hypothetical protein n=1 Tax=Pseudomonas syringae TaxID=317 RepID=UPI003F769C12
MFGPEHLTRIFVYQSATDEALLFSFLVFLLSSSALAGEPCKELIPDEAALFQTYDLDKDFACLYNTSDIDEYATLSFYSKQKHFQVDRFQ